MNIPRVVIAGATSGVGKTTVSVAVMNALHEKGFIVQPFKVGPDFIDPSYHTLVTKRSSRNLDVWMMGERGVMECFANACEGADLAVIEGVMGLYDGMSGKDNYASTAHVAKLLKAPVLLVLDASKTARSAAAMILGYMGFDKGVKIAAVILNNVASDRHATYLREAIDSKLRCPVLGIIRRERDSRIEERHLGLIPTAELKREKRMQLVRTARKTGEQIDIEKALQLFGKHPLNNVPTIGNPRRPVVKIAVALDESFNFYYQDNLEALQRAGAKLAYFSPVNDNHLPEGIQGIILGGGFPEILADELEDNRKMCKSIRNAVEDGMPTYAECGGLMYLSKSISGYNGSKKKRRMIGIVDADTVMTRRLTLNYTDAQCNGPLLGNSLLRGHEFHYSELQNVAYDTRYAYKLSKGSGIAHGNDGIMFSGNGLAAYMHLHFFGNSVASRIVDACLEYSRA